MTNAEGCIRTPELKTFSILVKPSGIAQDIISKERPPTSETKKIKRQQTENGQVGAARKAQNTEEGRVLVFRKISFLQKFTTHNSYHEILGPKTFSKKRRCGASKLCWFFTLRIYWIAEKWISLKFLELVYPMFLNFCLILHVFLFLNFSESFYVLFVILCVEKTQTPKSLQTSYTEWGLSS